MHFKSKTKKRRIRFTTNIENVKNQNCIKQSPKNSQLTLFINLNCPILRNRNTFTYRITIYCTHQLYRMLKTFKKKKRFYQFSTFCIMFV